MVKVGDNLIDTFITKYTDEEDEVLRELSRETHLKAIHPRMLSGHIQGRLLEMLSSIHKPEQILEIGTFTGYSAICMARGLNTNGKLHTLEINDELVWLSNKYFKKSGLTDKIIQYIGNACDIIPTTFKANFFDLVFVDGDKKEYPEYYNKIIDKVKPGGLILVDNVFWNGKVFEKVEVDDESTKGVLEFLEIVKNDARVSKTILPVRDGLMMMYKK